MINESFFADYQKQQLKWREQAWFKGFVIGLTAYTLLLALLHKL